MANRRPLSLEQIESLKKSPHVRFVNANILSFTAEFKEKAYEKRQLGVPIREILTEAGIDPELLGAKRMRNLSSALNSQGRRGCGFSDIVKKTSLPPEKAAARTTEEKVAKLQHELAYVRQEVEYLKKIYLADREAYLEWDLKHRRKSNSK